MFFGRRIYFFQMLLFFSMLEEWSRQADELQIMDHCAHVKSDLFLDYVRALSSIPTLPPPPPPKTQTKRSTWNRDSVTCQLSPLTGCHNNFCWLLNHPHCTAITTLQCSVLRKGFPLENIFYGTQRVKNSAVCTLSGWLHPTPVICHLCFDLHLFDL